MILSLVFFFQCATKEGSEAAQETTNDQQVSYTDNTKKCIGYICIESVLRDPYQLAKKEVADDSSLDLDSIYQQYLNSVSVVIDFSVNPMVDLEPGINVMNIGVNGMKDYEDRVLYMTSEIKGDFTLMVGSEALTPKLSSFENYTSFSDNCKVVLVFVPEKEIDMTSETEFLLTYDDQIFGTGKTKYKLTRELNNPISI